MKKALLTVVLIVSVMIQLLEAQQIDSLLNVYDSKVPQEKIYVHFDNSLYTPGQTVWYKAYLVKDLAPSTFSKNLYIDWSDESGNFIQRTVAPVINTTAYGDFTVPKNYTGNRLQVMAYTKWMLNFDSSLLFHQIIKIAQPQILTGGTNLIVPVTTVQFFPEGGDMIANVPGYIAFKALNTEGLPVQIAGVILNKNKQVVASFQTAHDGMGKVLLKPLSDETYTAEWKDPRGITRTTPLPAAKASGLVLTINDVAAIRPFTIERSAASSAIKKITIIGTMNQQVVFKTKADLTEKTKISASIPATDLPSGVLQLTVFDDRMQALAERVLFVNNDEYLLPAEVHADSLNLEKRGRNVYTIELGDTIPVSLSLAITEGDDVYDSSKNIVSQLLLSSEIKGRIHDPAYYFSSPEDSVAQHLDLVMLTNGWRRFVWNDVLTGKIPTLKYTADTAYLSLEGKIDKISEERAKRSALVNMILVSKDSTKQMLFAPLQPDGSFKIENLIVHDTTKIYYRLNKVSIPLRSNPTISNSFLPYDPLKLNRPVKEYLPDTTGMANEAFVAAQQKKLDSLMKLTTLQEVVVTAKIKTRIEELDEGYTAGLFAGTAGVVYTVNVADDKNAKFSSDIFTYIKTRIPNGGAPRRAGFKAMPLTLFLDEQPIETVEDMTLYANMKDVAYVKYFPHFAGAPGNGAALAVYTKKGEELLNSLSQMYHTSLVGYTPVKEFYSPNYAEQHAKNFESDLRRTLLWQPNIASDGTNKKIKVSFYNNDISHTFQLVLEGIAEDGRLIHISKLLK